MTFTRLFTALTMTAAAFAWQGHSHSAPGKPVQITGQVVEVACFLGHNTTGADHAKCAETCARTGNPLAIFDGKQIYLPVSMDHKNPNEKLMTYIEKKVTVTGSVIDKAGLKGIAISKVEAAK